MATQNKQNLWLLEKQPSMSMKNIQEIKVDGRIQYTKDEYLMKLAQEKEG